MDIDCCCWVIDVGVVGRTGRDSYGWTFHWSRYHMELSDWSRRVLGAGYMTDNREYDGDQTMLQPAHDIWTGYYNSC